MKVKILICEKFFKNSRNKTKKNDTFYFNLNLKNYMNNNYKKMIIIVNKLYII